MRLIDLDAISEDAYWCRDALAEALAGAPIVEPEPDCDICPELHEARQTIAKYLLKEQQWIPCSERLPEDEDYRPYSENEDGVVWWFNGAGLMGLGWYYPCLETWAYYDEMSCSEKLVDNVIAWMPLPDPYKGD